MNDFLAGARSLYHYKCTILCGLGRPIAWKWQPSVIQPTRILQQSVVGRWLIHTNSYRTLGLLSRKVGLLNHPLFIIRQKNLYPFINKNKFSSFDNRPYSTKMNFQTLQPRKKRRVLNMVLQTLKVLCLITGTSVWAMLFLYFVTVNEQSQSTSKTLSKVILPQESELLIRCLKFLDTDNAEKLVSKELILNSNDYEEVVNDGASKLLAFKGMWDKLMDDKGIQYSLGTSIDLCAFDIFGNIDNDLSWNVDEVERKTKWIANCYIEGSNGMATLSILFERHDTQSEWVATKLHLEKIKESGEVICNISGSLPNGLTNFTCLSDVKDLVE